MKKYLILSLLAIALSSCIEEPAAIQQEEEISVVTDFDFNTTNTVAIDLQFSLDGASPLKGVPVSLWDAPENEGGKLIYKALTNGNGQAFTELPLPAYLDKVVLEVNHVGIPNSLWLPVNQNRILFSYNGSLDESQLTSPGEANHNGLGAAAAPGSGLNEFAAEAGLTFNYLGDYNSQGVPAYLDPERASISAQLLEYINASLPESQPVPQYHPTFLANGKKTTLEIVATADVWVTFVHEGAGFRNAIGFYTYDTETPPQSLNDLQTINIIFPNFSFAGSGGGLYSGDKVNIGRFEAGTSIGLVLLADGWDGSNSENYRHIVYADKPLNSEADESLRQHNVLLWDEENQLFLMGFEDIPRDNSGCDNDFNDAILFVTSNPVEAISIADVNPVDKPDALDTDGDGINDIYDEYPNDGNRAYDSFYPSATSFGTFAFEDNWPNYGDYDFNDLVIDYQFKHVLNADNEVVSMQPSFKIRAIGAGFRNGFGFATELNPSDVSSVTGSSLNAGYITLNGNGTEAGQSKAVFIVSDNVHDQFSTGGFVNTEEENSYFEPQTLTLDIEFTSPKSMAQIGAVPYNPFVIISQNRGREVHLPGYTPTDKLDTDFFGTLDDASVPSQGIYYKSRTDLPWAIHLPESFAYPKEKADIREGHLRFSDWARSSGYSYMDWYRNQTGYRQDSRLYQKN